MQLLLYLLVYPLLWAISILPFRLLYLLSDFVYVLVYRVVGYRKKTVRENLSMALPDLSDTERRIIEKKFYQHMCDMFLEMIKSMTISDKEILERFTYTNLDTFIGLEKKGKSIALMCAHYASYEWVMTLNKLIDFDGYVIYKRISNKYFDRLVHKIRSRFNVSLVTTKEILHKIQSNQRIGIHGLYGFAADQSPKATKSSHYTNFMGIESPVYTGVELLAKRFDMPVIFLNTSRNAFTSA